MDILFYSVTGKLVGQVCSPAVKDIWKMWQLGADDGFERLRDTVSTIEEVLLDAADNKATAAANSHEMKHWMGKIKTALGEAEDVLDDFLHEDLRRKAKGVCVFFSSSNQVCFRFKMGKKVKDIRERLDAIAEDRAKFHLVEPNGDMQVVASTISDDAAMVDRELVEDFELLTREECDVPSCKDWIPI